MAGMSTHKACLSAAYQKLNYHTHWAQTSRGSVEPYFGLTVYGSGQAASRAYFPQLRVPSTLGHRADSVRLGLGSRSSVFPALCGREFVRRFKMVFEQVQRIVVLEHYFQTQLYARGIWRMFPKFRQPSPRPPTKSMISWLVLKFRETGSWADWSRVHPPTVITAGKIKCTTSLCRCTLSVFTVLRYGCIFTGRWWHMFWKG